jgi:hypothetical protein
MAKMQARAKKAAGPIEAKKISSLFLGNANRAHAPVDGPNVVGPNAKKEGAGANKNGASDALLEKLLEGLGDEEEDDHASNQRASQTAKVKLF